MKKRNVLKTSARPPVTTRTLALAIVGLFVLAGCESGFTAPEIRVPDSASTDVVSPTRTVPNFSEFREVGLRGWEIDSGGPGSKAAARVYLSTFGDDALRAWDTPTRLDMLEGTQPRAVPAIIIYLAKMVAAGIAAAIGWDLWQEIKHHFWACIGAIASPFDTHEVYVCSVDIVSSHF